MQMKHNYGLHYKNVVLRPLEKTDIELLRTWRNKKENTIYLRNLPYITPKMQLQWYGQYEENMDEIAFAILETEEFHEVVGSVSLYHFEESSAEFGKIMIGDSRCHKKKVGFWATALSLYIGFKQLGLEEIYCFVHKDNIAARITYERVGFEESTQSTDYEEELKLTITKDMFYKKHDFMQQLSK